MKIHQQIIHELQQKQKTHLKGTTPKTLAQLLQTTPQQLQPHLNHLTHTGQIQQTKGKYHL